MRDGGDPAGALKLFLGSVELDQLIAQSDGDGETSHSGALYGNVGRCLFLMGRTDEALRCLRSSGRKLEDDVSEGRLSNQAYARQWIGEALAAAGDIAASRAFLIAAEDMLLRSLPARARRVRELMHDCGRDGFAEPTPTAANRIVKQWLNRAVHDRSTNDMGRVVHAG